MGEMVVELENKEEEQKEGQQLFKKRKRVLGIQSTVDKIQPRLNYNSASYFANHHCNTRHRCIT